MQCDRDRNSYPFPFRWLERRPETFGEWKLLHMFYYLKNEGHRKGQEQITLTIRSIEHQFKLQKLKNRAITIDLLLDPQSSYLPEQPCIPKTLTFTTHIDGDQCILIPDLFIKPPFSWLDRWAAPAFHRPKRMSITDFTCLFTLLLSMLREKNWKSDIPVHTDLDALLTLFALPLHHAKVEQALRRFREAGLLAHFSLTALSLHYTFSLDEYAKRTALPDPVEFIDENYTKTGSALKQCIVDLVRMLPYEDHDPLPSCKRFPYHDFLAIMHTLGRFDNEYILSLISTLRQQTHDLSPCLDVIQLKKKFDTYPKATHECLLFLVGFLEEAMPWHAGKLTPQMEYMAGKAGVTARIHHDTLIAGPVEGKTRKEKTLPLSVSVVDEIWIFPIFENLTSNPHYRIQLTAFIKNDEGPSRQLFRQVYFDHHRERYLPPLRIHCPEDGKMYMKLTCSKAVQHLAMRLWMVVMQGDELREREISGQNEHGSL